MEVVQMIRNWLQDIQIRLVVIHQYLKTREIIDSRITLKQLMLLIKFKKMLKIRQDR